jgi:hypothetical protein
VDDEDTQVGPAPQSDTDRRLAAIALVDALVDTLEWDDTDRDVPAQGKIETTPQMFEDTGVMIVDSPTERPVAQTAIEPVEIVETPRFEIRFKNQRATTAGDWPPEPRKPAIKSPQIRERAFRRAGVYKSVGRPDTKN